MDDALLVRGFERVGDLPRDRQRLVERGSGPGDAIREQGLALDQLHHQRAPRRFLEAVDLRDVRMIERGEQARLALEARQALGIVATASGRTLMATSRSSFVSRAR